MKQENKRELGRRVVLNFRRAASDGRGKVIELSNKRRAGNLAAGKRVGMGKSSSGLELL